MMRLYVSGEAIADAFSPVNVRDGLPSWDGRNCVQKRDGPPSPSARAAEANRMIHNMTRKRPYLLVPVES